MRAPANHRADLGKVLESHLKVLDGQTQVTWLLPRHTAAHLLSETGLGFSFTAPHGPWC